MFNYSQQEALATLDYLNSLSQFNLKSANSFVDLKDGLLAKLILSFVDPKYFDPIFENRKFFQIAETSGD